MLRGEIWTLQDDGYASKARPVVIIQGETGDTFDSVILCLFTTHDSTDIENRVAVYPTTKNGLRKPSFVMTDKIITIAKSELGDLVGALTSEQMHAISRQLAKLLVITKEDIDS